MKHFYLRTLVLILINIIGEQAFADFDRNNKIDIDGIIYYLDDSNNYAEIQDARPVVRYLETFDIPSSVIYNGTTYTVTSIGNDSFRGCTYLTSITIPNSITTIYEQAFRNLSKLSSVTIPASVTKIYAKAFQDCYSLAEIKVDPNNKTYDSRDNCNAIIETATNTLVHGFKTSVIPNTVTSIGAQAFYHGSGFSSITIPNSVTSIGYQCFYKSGLNSLIIPNSVTSIGADAFKGCSGLETIRLPNNLSAIGSNIFSGCSNLKSIAIPNSVTTIGMNAFCQCSNLETIVIGNNVLTLFEYAFSSCSSLTDIYCYTENIPTYYSPFQNSDITNATLHVPASSIDAYTTDATFKNFGKIVPLTDSDPTPDCINTLRYKNNSAELFYGIDGKQIRDKARGLNIVRQSDGTTKKVLVK